jgi:hypothetical protein
MNGCERSYALGRESGVDESHTRECSDCRDATLVHAFFRKLAAADDLAPALPDPRVLLLKAELTRRNQSLHAEAERTRWTGIGMWAAIVAAWLVVITWKLGEIRSVVEGFAIAEILPGGAAATAVLVAALGSLVALTVFAVAVHSLLAEL